jgi:hypothetical protein
VAAPRHPHVFFAASEFGGGMRREQVSFFSDDIRFMADMPAEET